MTTEAKAAAARRNGALSRGPRTIEGKARSSMNALRHGLTAEAALVIPGEDPADLKALGERMRADLAPVGELEERLVERVVETLWRLQRVGAIEAGLLAVRLYQSEAAAARAEADRHVHVEVRGGIDWSRWSADGSERIETVTDPAKREAALRDAREAGAATDTPVPRLGRAFEDAAPALTTLGRYQAGLEKSLTTALHELQRVQARRGGDRVPPPAALDVTLTTEGGADGGDGFVS